MAVYSPTPSYNPLPMLAVEAPSYPSTSQGTRSPSQARHVSLSERMLMETLRRADKYEKTSTQPNDSDPDYFSRPSDNAWSASGSASPVRNHKKLSSHTYLAPPSYASRSPSPVTVRGVERDRIHPRRTPSPSPHPYRPASPRTAGPPSLNRIQTAPTRSQLNPSRPSTPSQLPRRSTSPVRYHSRRESSSGLPVSPSTSYQKQRAHEELLRTRLEGVLAKQEAPVDPTTSNVSAPTSRSRGTSFSRTAPPNATVTGDQWAWSQPPTTTLAPIPQGLPSSPQSLTRSPSVSRTGNAPPRTISSQHLAAVRPRDGMMITPPPSPPYQQPAHIQESSSGSNTSASSANASRAPSQSRQQLGYGSTPSRSPSNAPSSRVTPPPFDARSASLALKEQQGYVSFADIEGLGEPAGMDADDSDGEGGESRGRGRWWEVWRK
ncbi:hypothetical protein FRB99_005074 [Tulasnella sp. 403]|nr:hypothetical protein FRB99_005074 [Tulasnella sp. 403]